jgi:hypothetical protein
MYIKKYIFINMIGGKLCENNNNINTNDIYTIGKEIHPMVYEDINDPTKLIKIIKNKREYNLTEKISTFELSAKVFGYFECTFFKDKIKYSVAQQRIQARNFNKVQLAKKNGVPSNKLELEEVGEPINIEKIPYNVSYMVIERLNGNSLDKNNKNNNIIDNIDQIYNVYNLFLDKGIVLKDLFARNIIKTIDGKIYFIDFEPTLTDEHNYSIPLNKRLSKEKLMKQLISEK